MAAANVQKKFTDSLALAVLDSPTSLFPTESCCLRGELLARLSGEDSFVAFGTQFDIPLVLRATTESETRDWRPSDEDDP